MMLKEWLKLNHSCCLCLETTPKRLCTECEQDFLVTPLNPCYCCGLPQTLPDVLCGECLTLPPAYDQTYSPFLYCKPLSDLILQFKAQNDCVAGEALAQLFSEKIQNLRHTSQPPLQLPDLLTAVPSHWTKRWQRGFNPAEVFCRHISKDLNIPMYTAIRRQKSQVHDQKKLSRKERNRAMRNAFIAKKPLVGKHIAIVDDVMTTGATVNAVAYALKNAGASYVTVWALARTPSKT